MRNLSARVCEPCQSGAPALTSSELEELNDTLPGWSVVDLSGIKQLRREFLFKNFAEATNFVNRVADLAESEGHHPALLLEWGKATVSWWTHKIEGVHQNDVVMAAKTDAIYDE